MANRRMSTVTLIILIPSVTIIIGFISAYYLNLPKQISNHEAVILGQTRWSPGSQAALRVIVRNSQNGEPLPGSKVRISLQSPRAADSVLVFEGSTDQTGSANIHFRTPDDEVNQTLIVETESILGSDVLKRSITMSREYRVLLTTDKPIYQPGQTMHVRALALSTFDLSPANEQDIEFTIADGKGNKVLRKTVSTSTFGAAWIDFQLANEVNTGAYKITAAMGDTISEKTVTVEHYVLPKFEVEIQTERTFYRPGDLVIGSLDANYFFGKPVAGGEILIQVYTFDVEQSLVVSLEGTTGDDGSYPFQFELPDYIAGSELDAGLGRIYIRASVIDLAQHAENSTLSIPISERALIIEAIPEGGQFLPGVENIFYLLTSYPDGSPAAATLELAFYNENNKKIQTETSPYGLTEVRITPNYPYQQIHITAHDSQGNFSEQDFEFNSYYSEESVLLRPELPVYRIGETMKLDIFTSNPSGWVYLDIIREGQMVSTRSIQISKGHAEFAIDLTPDLAGTLEIHAYKILRSGSIARDTRLVVVDHAKDLNISITPDRDIYQPGALAQLDVQVIGTDGTYSQSALGIAIVDESVFALAEQDPGFAKLYFMLEQELLTPKYDIHGFSIPTLVTGVPVSSDSAVRAIETTAQASLSASTAMNKSDIQIYSLNVNSHKETIQRVTAAQSRYFTRLSYGLIVFSVLLPLISLGLIIWELRNQRRLGRSLRATIILIAVVIVLIALWPTNKESPWARTLPDKLRLLTSWLSYDIGLPLIVWLSALGILAYIVLTVIARKRKESKLGWSLGLLPLYLILIVATLIAASLSERNVQDEHLLAGILSFSLFPLAFLLRGFGFGGEKKSFASITAIVLAGSILVGFVPALISSTGVATDSMAMRAMVQKNGAMWGPPLPVEMPAALEGLPVEMQNLAMEESGALSANMSTSEQPPRLRQFFPETMLWLPDAVTDLNGTLSIDFPVADSITTWRLTALASSKDGRIGSVNLGMRVFQDFFIDLDLPAALTVGDEVSIPVGIFNYLTNAQDIRLELEKSDWFDLLDESTKEISIPSNEITVVYFRIKATRFGRHPFKVTAWGTQMSDAILKEIQVYPNGKQFNFSESDRLNAGAPIRQNIQIPADAIPGTQTLLVKIYPGILSQVIEGLDEILRMPNGCFEQTSSTTYPNVLVLDYLQSTSQASPEIQFKAEEYINLGYQRLTTFEVQSSGGFSLFGDAPADRMLTAYGLQEFADMSRVYNIDQDLIQRAAEWLFSQQSANGSWENDRGLVHESTWANLANDRLPVTAYITWSLVEAGFAKDPHTQAGISYIREYQAQAEDPYVLALVANALTAYDLETSKEMSPSSQSILERLAKMAIQEGGKANWLSNVATFMGSHGQTGSIETTALAALAFIRSESNPDLGNAALSYIIRQKDSFGTWYSTQATVLALKALIQSVRAGAEKVNAAITVSLNGSQTRTLNISADNYDVVQMISFEDLNLGGKNEVQISMQGEGNLMYQVVGSYYLPWDMLERYEISSDQKELLNIELDYDRTTLSVNDEVALRVTISLNEADGKVESALIDLGIPPGFSVLTEDLTGLVEYYNDVPEDYAFPSIQRFELTGRQILIYISNLTHGNPLTFTIRLQAKYPLLAQTPSSNAYDYYNPEVSGEIKPQILEVQP